MKLLAFETSSPIGTVALAVSGDIRERTIAAPREQTDRMLPLVDELLAEAGFTLGALDAIAFGRGPGSFTGLRIATALAQGLALAAGLPVVTVSSLAALAQRAFREHGVRLALCCVDARMGEVYSAAYRIEGGLAAALGEERLGAPETVEPPRGGKPRGWSAAGSGCAAYADALAPLLARADAVLPGLVPAARDVVPLAAAAFAAGRVESPLTALPVYLRNESAWRRS